MNRVFLDLSPEESAIIALALAEGEQIQWALEETENQCQLCGYFIGDFQKSWETLRKQIPLLSGKIPLCEVIEERDWQSEYKKFLAPFNIGPLHIIPNWYRDIYSVPDHQFGIYLDAEMAFGTGAHETTKLCLARLVDYQHLFKNSMFLKKMIDVGCGSGILSIAAAKLGFGNIYGFDRDPDAVKISQKNAQQNETTISFAEADINGGLLGLQADFIAPNILAPDLIAHASLLVNTVKQYGMLSLSGILREELESVQNVFTPLVKRHWNCSISNAKTMGQWVEISYVRT
ncbi:MAG: 50S ribosomal protein L11 methyltransferase [Puniceicoccales bacterium]|jgi:ribosomal protein L11 methyltransferase|nr:50S ribosomal protein L11 methyltransferase [Puniceicoccales bacterium]